MYAVIKTGGKQYRVTPGDVLKVETLDAEVGAAINFEEVLMIADGDNITVGTPTIASAKVAAEVIAHGRAKKVEIIKFRRRKHHQKRTGHRQNFTQVQIQNINGKGSPAKKATPKTADASKDTDNKSTAKKATKATKAAKSATKATATKKAAAKPAAKKTASTATKSTASKKASADKATTEKAASTSKAATSAAKKPAAKKAAPKKTATKKSGAADDLTKIEGIGPKAAEALTAAGIASYTDLSKAKVPAIQKILDEADGKFGAMNPGTWAKQAKLAATDKWDELKKWQDEMDGGIEK